MYIGKINIANIRSIGGLEMAFPKPVGWHVIIGDNGAGKSSIIRAVAALLIGPDQIGAVLPVWSEWLRNGANHAKMEIEVMFDPEFDKKTGQSRPPTKHIVNNAFELKRNGRIELISNANTKGTGPINFNWGSGNGWFSVAYGPFRRFTGGDSKWNKVFDSAPKAGAHLSVFGEDIALTEALDWLKELDRKRLKEKENSIATENNEVETIFNGVKDFINYSKLLPQGASFDSVDIDGELVFRDAAGNAVKVVQMSDGFRAILSLTLELVRQLVITYGYQKVFQNVTPGNDAVQIALPGVVLIDEIDAHLHPSWQTEIGLWFTKYFPSIQFIVTTHSPLVCRACSKGSIWRLTNSDSGTVANEVTGIDRDKLIFGNILDAYGTDIFGRSPVRQDINDEKRQLLGRLNRKSALGNISDEEEIERQRLQLILATDAPAQE